MIEKSISRTEVSFELEQLDEIMIDEVCEPLTEYRDLV